MKRLSRDMNRIGGALAVSALVIFAAIAAAPRSSSPRRTPVAPDKVLDAPSPQVRFTNNGRLLRPTGYRKWTFIGTPLTPNDMNGGRAPFPDFHTVYINPQAYDHYEATGLFPDGTVVIKELVSVGAKAATSGKGYFMGDFIGLEVAVKNKTRFPDEPGNWAYFSFGHEYPLKKQVTPQAVVNCSACHGANADDDYVFTQYYPVLRAAKDSATKD